MARKGQFQPGQSGNPGGRPKGYDEILKLARDRAPAAILRLEELTHDENGKVAVAACQALLDRAWGKPAQVVQGDQDGGPVKVEMTGDAARAELFAVLARLAPAGDPATGDGRAVPGGGGGVGA